MITSAPPTPPPVFHRVVSAPHLHADVRLSPALIGRATLRVMLADEGGRPIDHAVVTANIDMAAMSMDSTFHAMSGGPHGTYTETLRLTMPGHWRIELKVKRAGFPTETLDVPVFVDLP